MQLDYSKLKGVLPAVIQEVGSERVLMVGFMNEEAFRRTVETGKVTFFSRSRNALWVKGEISRHHLLVREITTDCDQDALLLKVEAIGPGVCHNGYKSCFYRRLAEGKWVELEKPAFDPRAVYGGKS